MRLELGTFVPCLALSAALVILSVTLKLVHLTWYVGVHVSYSACLCVCICCAHNTHTHTHTHTHIHTRTHTQPRTYRLTCIRIHAHTRIHTMYIQAHTCTHTCTHCFICLLSIIGVNTCPRSCNLPFYST